MPILDWIDVGTVSAELDENLPKYFYDAGVSKALISDSKRYLLLGRKGAGKTAVFLHLASKPKGLFRDSDIVVPLTIEDYNWKAHQALSDPNKSSAAQYRDSWRFAILVEAIRGYAQDAKRRGKVIPKKMQAAQRLLEHLFGEPVPTIGEVLKDKVLRLAKLKLPSAGLGLEDGDVHVDAGEVSFASIDADSSLKSLLSHNIERVTTYLETALFETLDGTKLYVIFDKVDEEWLPNSEIKSKELLGGLLHAAHYLTGKFNSKLRPIVFLREDIFEALDTVNDKNKLRTDCSQTLKWNKASLERMTMARVNYYGGVAGQNSVAGLNDLFTVEPGVSFSACDYIFDRSFSRPRDFIDYLRNIIEFANAERANNQDVQCEQGRILAQVVVEAEPAYSTWLYNEIIDEWRTQRPAIYSYLDILSNLETRQFVASDFEKEYRNVFKTGGHRDLVREVLVFLFDASVIGYRRPKSPRTHFRCFNEMRKYEDSDSFFVHDGLVSHLGLTESRPSRT